MSFNKLPSNTKKLLDEIVNAENPTQYLSDRFDAATATEDDELRSLLRELKEGGYISIMWAENKPYRVVINNAARTYDERLAEYEAERAAVQNITYNITDKSVTIGNGNKIKGSTIAGEIDNYSVNTPEKKSFFVDHPVLSAVIAGVIVAFVMMFSFWEKIVDFIEGLF